jgi:hypothetical protein
VRRVVVRYKVKPELADANTRLIERVFAELEAQRPEGIRYASLSLEDGVSFVHIASIESADGSNPLAAIPSFAAFTRDIADRCDEPPVALDATVVGSYGLFDAST